MEAPTKIYINVTKGFGNYYYPEPINCNDPLVYEVGYIPADLHAQEVAELKKDLTLNARMLARQTDLARQAENERDELKAKLEPIREVYERFKKGYSMDVYSAASTMWQAIKKAVNP